MSRRPESRHLGRRQRSGTVRHRLHRRSSHGKYFRSARRQPSRHRSHQASCFDSAGCPRRHRHRSARQCSASGCLHSAARHPAIARRPTRSGRRSDHRFVRSGRPAIRRCRPGYRSDRRPPDCRRPGNSANHPSCCRQTAAACWSRSARPTIRCDSAKTTASHPGSAWKTRIDHRHPTTATACSRNYHRRHHPMESTRTDRRKKRIAAADWGSRP